MIDEAGEGDVRRGFTVEDLSQVSGNSEQFLALPFSGAPAFRIRGGIALSVPRGSQQPYQLFVLARDEVGYRRPQSLDDRADCRDRGERVGFTLSASGSSQSLITPRVW